MSSAVASNVAASVWELAADAVVAQTEQARPRRARMVDHLVQESEAPCSGYWKGWKASGATAAVQAKAYQPLGAKAAMACSCSVADERAP